MDKQTTYIENKIDELLADNPSIKRLGESYFLYSSVHDARTIPILAGGGSGHEPSHFGYIGKGMLAGAVAGDIFSPPSANDILTAIRFLNKGKGVFIIVKNFESDLRAFRTAINKARDEGIPVRYVVSHDDISVEMSVFKRRHRGVAGTLFLHKILGQAAMQGANLDELEQLGLAVASSVATLGVATKPTTCLNTHVPLFEIPENYISYGVGIHGELGYKTVPFVSSEKLVIELLNKLKMYFRWKSGQRYALLLNNLGQYPQTEEKEVLQLLLELIELEGITIDLVIHGTLMTSLDMAGLSVSLCRIDDDSWLSLLKEPTQAPAWPL